MDTQNAPSSPVRTAPNPSTTVDGDVALPEPQDRPAAPSTDAHNDSESVLVPPDVAPPPHAPVVTPGSASATRLDAHELLSSVTNNNRTSKGKAKSHIRGRPPWTPSEIHNFLEGKLPEYQSECRTNQTKSYTFYTAVTKELLETYGWGVFFADMVSQNVPLKLKTVQG